jgi:hypothetical protein
VETDTSNYSALISEINVSSVDVFVSLRPSLLFSGVLDREAQPGFSQTHQVLEIVGPKTAR